MTGGYGMIGAKVGVLLLLTAAPAALVLTRDGGAASAPPIASATAAAPPAVAISAPSPALVAARFDPAEASAAQPAAASADPLVIKRVLTIDGPFRHGDFVWDDKGVPPGPLVVTVDIGAQTLSVFRGGYEIGAAVILFGADDKPTPLGVFPITQKKAKHVSNLYGAPMPYMMRLTSDGVAIHGSTVERDSATNGCIGVPTEFAKLLFAQAKLGDKVIITNGERLQLGGAITAI
ncbi:MAG TPA: L,D-transpeptidase family protein [Sphingomonadaceae bacterium]|nr:L,D-transpeptidase family protein [Sphingomonadaceae bacterium]